MGWLLALPTGALRREKLVPAASAALQIYKVVLPRALLVKLVDRFKRRHLRGEPAVQTCTCIEPVAYQRVTARAKTRLWLLSRPEHFGLCALDIDAVRGS